MRMWHLEKRHLTLNPYVMKEKQRTEPVIKHTLIYLSDCFWPIAAGDDWQLPGQSGVSVHVLQHGAGSSSRLAEHS